VFILLFVLVVGCSESDSTTQVPEEQLPEEIASEPKEEVIEVTQEVIPGTEAPDDYHIFDGQTFIADVHSLPEGLEKVIFEIMLLSDDTSDCLDSEEPLYSNTCPPMPLQVYPFAVYQLKHDMYLLQFKVKDNNEDSEVYVRFNFEPQQWYKILVEYDVFGRKIILSINEKHSTTITGVNLDLDKASRLMNVHLGKGYNERLWSGKIAYFTIYDSEGNVYFEY